jgi:putative (di)nucleoside polyphosphate hydrolase
MPDPTSVDLPYRPCVGIVLINRQGMVFVAHRSDLSEGGAWQMPQGGIDEGESPAGAAARELEEEIGTAKAEIVAEHPDWLSYDFPEDMPANKWAGMYRGQTQRWFAFRFTGVDSDIDLEGAHSTEFDAWKWVGMAELPGLIVPFKRHVYEQVAAKFRHLAEATELDQISNIGAT